MTVLLLLLSALALMASPVVALIGIDSPLLLLVAGGLFVGGALGLFLGMRTQARARAAQPPEAD